MSKKKTDKVTVDGVEYLLKDLNEQQLEYVSHMTDLSRKINTSKFNLKQMQTGLDAHILLFKQTLEGN